MKTIPRAKRIKQWFSKRSIYLFNRIMGEVMKTARNRIDGKLVNEVVKNKMGLTK